MLQSREQIYLIAPEYELSYVNRPLKPKVYSVYSEDIVTAVDARMGRRPEGFLYVLQQKVTGGRPADRDCWDPAQALKIVTGGDKAPR